MTVIKHPITRFLPPSVSSSDTRLKSCGTTVGIKGWNEAISKARDLSIRLSALPFTLDGTKDTYIYAHPQCRGSGQSNGHLRARLLIPQQVDKDLPDPSIICRSTFVTYPLSDKPCNATLYDTVPLDDEGCEPRGRAVITRIHSLWVGILNVHSEVLVQTLLERNDAFQSVRASANGAINCFLGENVWQLQG